MRKKSLIVGTILFLGVLFLFQSPAVASCDYGKGKITSISPATLSTGDVLTIEGTGFGEINHFHINKSNTRCNGSVNVVYDYMGNIVAPLGCSMNDTLGWEWSKIISWSDNKIEIQIPDTFEDPQTTNVKTALDKNIEDLVKSSADKHQKQQQTIEDIARRVNKNVDKIIGNIGYKLVNGQL